MLRHVLQETYLQVGPYIYGNLIYMIHIHLRIVLYINIHIHMMTVAWVLGLRALKGSVTRIMNNGIN
jgi:hypothetical protein